MASLKGVAFALGGAGLALFVAGAGWAVLAQPPCKSATGTCPNWDTTHLTANVMFLCVGAVILEFAAVVFLFLHLRDMRRSDLPRSRAPKRASNGGASTSDGPIVEVRRSPPR